LAVKPPVVQVATRPVRPLMLYDGGCNFCKFWIAKWRVATAGKIDYLASQDAGVAQQFPELPREQLDAAVQLIEPDGRVFHGAEAVFRSLAQIPSLRWPLWLYRDVPGVAPVSEAAYGFIASHRVFFSFLTRLLWGLDAGCPSYSVVQWLFLRILGLIFLFAFLSLGAQIVGLIGHNGILPADQLMSLARDQFRQHGIGLSRYQLLPTLCWFNAGDVFLRAQCFAGIFLSLLLLFNFAPAPCLFLLWVIYLSLATVCQVFLGFQWDGLLLEVALLAIFFAPIQLLPGVRRAPPPSRLALWLLRWLLFRLMFESGMVKLTSRDPAWAAYQALNFHYETQPLPTWIGWYAHQLPPHVHAFCVHAMFAIELWVPFLIFAPRRLRFLGCLFLMLLQVIIFLTGNYCFFNLLTLALCLLLLDDGFLLQFLPARWRKPKTSVLTPSENPAVSAASKIRRGWPLWITAPFAACILYISLPQFLLQVDAIHTPPPGWDGFAGWLEPFRSINGYGLFAVMTTTRNEIIVEGSNDGQTWLPYDFRYKPGDVMRRPGFVAPFQPRLDWQMWFAALGSPRRNEWFIYFCVRLLQGKPGVLALLAHNPFPKAPPKYIRAELYEYHFTNFAERRATGAWWRRERVGEYLPPISLKDG
jgi:lipase maturation factor 1